VDAQVEEGFRWGKVEMIRGDDGDGVDAVWALGFGVCHFREAAVGTVSRDVEILRGFAAFFGVGGEGRSDQFEAVVDASGDTVDRANEASWAAADHA
jgi:hypothetical protein